MKPRRSHLGIIHIVLETLYRQPNLHTWRTSAPTNLSTKQIKEYLRELEGYKFVIFFPQEAIKGKITERGIALLKMLDDGKMVVIES